MKNIIIEIYMQQQAEVIGMLLNIKKSKNESIRTYIRTIKFNF